ncbi:MAG: FAD-dependent oxidoreductase, partial [Bacteroidota bacterium]
GGGDTAAEVAPSLAGLAYMVYLLVRRDEMRSSKIMQQRVLKKENIEVLWNTETVEVMGDDSGVNQVKVRNTQSGEESLLAATGFFVAIGHKPNTDIFSDQIDMDDTGYIKTVPGTSHTNVEGVFAAGDAQDSVYRQAVTAAGTGCMAALDAERFLAAKEVEMEGAEA